MNKIRIASAIAGGILALAGAVACAKGYLDGSSFSKASLLHQLKYEGFTDAQAAYGVSKAYR